MAPEEAQPNTPRRRGRPPGSKNRAPRKRAQGGDLVSQLNAMVAELISKNRQLRREVKKMTDRARKSETSKGVERGIRTISRRVQRALGTGATKKRSKAAAPANGKDSAPPAIPRREENACESMPLAAWGSEAFRATRAATHREYSNPDSAACCKSRGESCASRTCRSPRRPARCGPFPWSQFPRR